MPKFGGGGSGGGLSALQSPAARGLVVRGAVAFLVVAFLLFAFDLYSNDSWRRANGGGLSLLCGPQSGAAAAGANGGSASAGAAQAAADPNHRIPRIIHRVFLSGRENFDTLHNNPASSIRAEWDDWCRLLHERAGWEYRFWDLEAVDKLIAEEYPWFADSWSKYTTKVTKGDATRYFLMHKFGGLYIDMDVECYREGYDLLEGKDVVLQGTHPSEGLTNAVIASVSGHPFWPVVFQVLSERAGGGPIDATGPGCITEALSRLKIVELPPPPEPGKYWDENPYLGKHTWNNTVIDVMPTGTWYTPCWFTDGPCRQKLDEDKKNGIMKLDVVGYHRYSGTWNQVEESTDPAHQGKLEPAPS